MIFFNKLCDFFDVMFDLFYDVMGYVATGFKILFGLLVAAGILYIIYWIGKALFGFLKYYTQFA